MFDVVFYERTRLLKDSGFARGCLALLVGFGFNVLGGVRVASSVQVQSDKPRSLEIQEVSAPNSRDKVKVETIAELNAAAEVRRKEGKFGEIVELFQRAYRAQEFQGQERAVLEAMGKQLLDGGLEDARNTFVVEKTVELWRRGSADGPQALMLCVQHLNERSCGEKERKSLLEVLCNAATVDVSFRINIISRLIGSGEGAFDRAKEMYPDIRKLPITDGVQKFIVKKLLSGYRSLGGDSVLGDGVAESVAFDIKRALVAIGDGIEVDLERRSLKQLKVELDAVFGEKDG